MYYKVIIIVFKKYTNRDFIIFITKTCQCNVQMLLPGFLPKCGSCHRSKVLYSPDGAPDAQVYTFQQTSGAVYAKCDSQLREERLINN